MSVLPVSNVINVTIVNTPSGLAEKNVNSLAILTNEPSASLNDFDVYVSAAQVATDFGSASVTAAMANAIFAQTPNPLSGGGRLVIIGMQAAVSATEGTCTTANISANLNDIIAVNNGDLRITVNSVVYDLTQLNFTGSTSFANVATILQGRINEVTVEATANGLKFTSKKVGTVSTVALAAVAGGTGTALNGAGYFNAAAAVSVAGANSTGETVIGCVNRVSGNVGIAGVMTNLNLEDTAIIAAASAFQAKDMIFLHHVASGQDILGVGTTIKTAAQRKTRILLYTQSQAAANLYKAAYAGRAFSVNFNGSKTSSTMNLKELANITPDLGISQTMYAQCLTAGVDVYVSYDGVPSVYSTGGNDYFDNVYSDLALKFALEAAGFNYLRQTSTKVPQTEPGMDGLKAAYSGVCDRFVTNGCIAPGAWTSSDTFGDPVIFKQNVLTRGYYTYSLPIVKQSAAQRALRKAPLVQIAIKRAGAIHTSDVIVIVND